MTCTRYETDLALYVERDLPEADAAAVEAHLAECPSCPRLLAELYASQALVKDLAAEEIDPDALAAVGLRAIVAAARDRRSRPSVPWWAAAAAIVLSLGAAIWAVRLLREADPARTAAVSPPPPPAAPPSRVAAPTVAPVATSSSRSTLPGLPAVSPRMGPSHVRRGRTSPPAAAVPTLSPDDADQLARAVVAIARIQRVEEAPVAAPPSPAPAPLMRLATADPDVVIYWQLEPNGGE
jgi:putative zinc finger protein